MILCYIFKLSSYYFLLCYNVILNLSIFQGCQNCQTFLRFLFCATRLRLSLELIFLPAFCCNLSLKINSSTYKILKKIACKLNCSRHVSLSSVWQRCLSPFLLYTSVGRSRQLCKQGEAPHRAANQLCLTTDIS